MDRITPRDWIVVVSGLPRSGTSLAMAMLAAGGCPILADDMRPADPDNPRGYFEFDPVKRLRRNASWLGQAQGRAVKVVSYLLDALPTAYAYRVVFMERSLDEILASQRVMLARQGKDAGDDLLVRTSFEKHLRYIGAWLEGQPNMTVCRLRYADGVAEPAAAARQLDAFLGGGLDITAMAAVVDPALHRQRAKN